MANETVLPDLSPEQMDLLRKRFLMEMDQDKEQSVEVSKLSVAAVSDHEDFSKSAVYTNVTAGYLIIDDLGIKSPSGRFTPETFKPYECKDLRRIYSPRELRASKYLVIAQEPSEVNNGHPLLLKGEHTKEHVMKLIGTDSLAVMAESNPKGSFEDPEFGKTDFDHRLAEVERREHEEDLESRKGWRGKE